MGAADTIKEFARIATTAGLTKDVIDLLDKKASLLAEQVASLEQENTTLLRENRNLKVENENLKTQLQNAQPVASGLSEGAIKILKFAFDSSRDFTAPQIAATFKMKQGVVDFHIDELSKKDFIFWTSPGFAEFGEPTPPPDLSITAEGREFIVKNGLA